MAGRSHRYRADSQWIKQAHGISRDLRTATIECYLNAIACLYVLVLRVPGTCKSKFGAARYQMISNDIKEYQIISNHFDLVISILRIPSQPGESPRMACCVLLSTDHETRWEPWPKSSECHHCLQHLAAVS